MPTEVIMPKVDMDMASGRIMVWHVAEGEQVAKGEPLFDIETDKSAMEIESPADGILHHTAPIGSAIPIGTPCAWLYAPGENVGDQPAPFAGLDGPAAASTPDDPKDPDTPDTPGSTDSGNPPANAAGPDTATSAAADAANEPMPDKPRATPQARRLAADAALDLAAITGSGPRGRVQGDDVRAAIAARDSDAALLTQAPATRFVPETGPLGVTRSKGGTGTPVVLIHGFASDATSWAPLETHLRHRPLIRIDLPGHGKSPKLRIDSFAELVKALRDSFDTLDLKAAHLVGHSLGGALSLALADTRPAQIASLTLIAPAGLGPDVNGAALTGICRASRPESLAPWLRALVADETLITDSYARLAMTARADPALRAAQTRLSEVLFPDGVQAFDLRAALDRISAPTRIIWGKRDAIIPWQHALRAPGTTALHLIDGVGHMPQLECPDVLGRIMTPGL